MKLISLVIPVYNEEQNIPLLYRELKQVFLDMGGEYDYEIIFVNDGSQDGSVGEIKKIIVTDNRVRALSFSRNFGHQAALVAGLEQAQGVAIISLDCDLQDPPSIIKEMLDKWLAGAKVVYARRRSRQDGFLKKQTAAIYYKILDKFSDVKIPRNVGDFRLIDARVLMALKKMPEKDKYLRGLVAWLGFKYDFVDFDRPNRQHGQSGYSWKKMIKLALDGLLNFSFWPLKLGLILGIGAAVAGLIMLIGLFLKAIIFGINYPFLDYLAIVIFILIGFLFILIWILGEYIGRIYNGIKDRPLYIVEEKINFPAESFNN